ncbi:hypothetical protein B0H16DRAFT_1710824 [Mycena metata]|uniref:DUF6593 domain-containing protein n=1 Tax=Mycena metata TaxID=1033252 RepID=A0AAD7KER1_9AGAR|nr:hypothetical protein B0H16DRAFT_1710824 [Mycena metata]
MSSASDYSSSFEYSSPESYLSATSSSDPLEVSQTNGSTWRRAVKATQDNYLRPMKKGIFSGTCPGTVPRKLPLPEPAAAAYLDFSSNVLTNTTLSWRGTGRIAYQVSADNKLSTIQIRRSDMLELDAPLAVISRGTLVLPDRITLRGYAWCIDARFKMLIGWFRRNSVVTVKVSSWIKPEGTGMFSPIPGTMEQNGEVYEWKMNDSGLLSLWFDEEQIAWYQPAPPQPEGRSPVVKPPYIALQEAALNMQDIVVIGCLVLRQKLRWDAKKNSNNYLASTAREPQMFSADTV